MVAERGTPLPSLVLPSLTKLIVRYDHDDDRLEMFHGATLGKLETVVFIFESKQIGDFLGTFERVALATSTQNTLSLFRLLTSRSWNPTFSSLLSFTQMRDLYIGFNCVGGCSSTVDDGIIINLARAMPKLEALMLGNRPCRRIPTGVTAKGLVALAHHCPNLSILRVHIKAASITTPPTTIGITPNVEPSTLRRDCTLTHLDVHAGAVGADSRPYPGSHFPRIQRIFATHEGWQKVEEAINFSRRTVDHSGEQHSPLYTLK